MFDLSLLQSLMQTTRLGRDVSWHDSLPSTQDLARAKATQGSNEGLIVIADEQTAGRGRQGRTWVSPRGKNLYFTLLLRPKIQQLRGLSMALPLAIVEALAEVAGVDSSIKWPNDVLVTGKKISGVLIDAELEGQEVEYVLAGVGINVNFDPRPYPEIAATATSIVAATSVETSREAILAAALNHLEVHYNSLADDPHSVFTAWRRRLTGLGGPVNVHAPDASALAGIAEDVRPDGSLLLRLPDGSLRSLAAGELEIPASASTPTSSSPGL